MSRSVYPRHTPGARDPRPLAARAAIVAGALIAALLAAVSSARPGVADPPASSTDASAAVTALPSSRGDFGGDGKADVLWRNVSTAAMEIWMMNGAGTPTTGPVTGGTPPPNNWKVQALADFGADLKADVLWRNATSGAAVLWTMNGFNRDASAALTTETDLNWAMRGAGDFDGDGRADILWRHEAASGMRIWFAGSWTSISVADPGLAWTLQGLGDFNGDGKADILWRHAISNEVVIWMMNGATPTGASLGYPTITLNVAGVGDLNGDGKSDVLWRDELSGDLELWQLDGSTISAVSTIVGPAGDWRLQRVLDFDGDGKADILWRNFTSGNTVVWLMDGASRLGGGIVGTQSDFNWQVQGGFNWQFAGALAAPSITPPSGGTFVSQATVTLAATPGATIRYTLNGSEPTPVSTRYTAPFPVTATTTVKAKAFREGWTDSATSTATYTRKAAAPVLSTPSAPPFFDQTEVSIGSESGTEVRYTVGWGVTPSEPTPTSALYAAPILVDRQATIRAKAFRSGWAPSDTVSGSYSISLSTPVPSPVSGSYSPDTYITATGPAGAVTHYTLGQTPPDPTEADPALCAGCRLPNPGATLKVRAFRAGCTPSAVASATYSIAATRGNILLVSDDATVDAPVVSRLQARGFSVTSKTSSQVTRNDAGGMQLVLISGTASAVPLLSPGTEDFLPTKDFSTVRVPTMVLNSAVYGAMRMTNQNPGNHGVATTNFLQLPVGSGHPLAAGLEWQQTVTTGTTSMSWGQPVGAEFSAQLVAANGSPLGPGLFGQGAGATLASGLLAPARRVGFFRANSSLTATGWGLFDAAVDWLVELRPKAYFVYEYADTQTETMYAGDVTIWHRLEGLGFTVLRKRPGEFDGDIQACQPVGTNCLDAHALVFISDSAAYNTNQVNKLLTTRAPVMTAKETLFLNLGWATARGNVSQQILNLATPVGGVPAGPTSVVPAATALSWGTVGVGAVVWGTVTVPGSPQPTEKPALFSYEKDALLANGSTTAPQRRLGFFGCDLGRADALTANGWALFDAAVLWNTGGDYDNDGLIDRDEWRYGFDPYDPDSDDDGVLDSAAVETGILRDTDPDRDGLPSANELRIGTDPLNPNTDGDLNAQGQPCKDGADRFPLDPARCELPADPTPTAPPRITLTEPTSATLTGCSVTPCP